MDNDKRAMLTKAEEYVETGDPIPDSVWSAVETAFDAALNGSPCPCGSGATYKECCRFRYVFVKRARKNMDREGRQVQKVEKKQAEQQASGKIPVTWICQVGIQMDGKPIVQPVGRQGEQRTPMNVAAILLTAYHEMVTISLQHIAQGNSNR